MKSPTRRRTAVALAGAAALVAGLAAPQTASGQTEPPTPAATTAFAGGTPVTLTRSGGWSWFEGPRALLDACELQVGSVATGHTPDGMGRHGDVDVVTLDLATGTPRVDTLQEHFQADDHNSPALLTMPGGKTLALWAGHRVDDLVRRAYRPPGVRHWHSLPSYRNPTGLTTYNNLAFLAAEGEHGVLYDVYRAQVTPTVLTSEDHGATWQRLGPMFDSTPHRPYLRYDDDGQARIDLATTDGHPRERWTGTSIYHGYVQGGVLRRSDGTPVTTLGTPTTVPSLTLVHQGDADHRAWTQDVVTTPNGPVITYSVRDLSEGTPAGLRNTYWYARWDGSQWVTHQIGYAGTSLYQQEEHYTGGVALDPGDPTRLVISTDVHPASGVPLRGADGWPHHELFEAQTADGGQTWAYTPITQGSTVDNVRPIVPDPAGGRKALVWMAGMYPPSFATYATRVRAIVTGAGDGTPCPAPAYEPGPNPLSGDFDGDGGLDYFHYQPGSEPDTIFWSGGTGARTVVRVDGTYTPIAFRRASNPGRDAIIWSNPNGQSHLWFTSGPGGRTFTSQPYNTERGATPVIGDYNGDGRDDVLHVRAGPGRDVLQLSSGWGYLRRTVSVSGSYRPLAGDVNGDGRDDVVFYAPGSAADAIWTFRADGTHRSWSIGVSGTYRPSIGDLDGNGTADVYWGRPDSSGYLWSFHPGPAPTYTSTLLR